MNKDLLNVPETLIEEHLSVLAEQILAESLLEYKREKLRKEIDLSLQERDKEKFLSLTTKLNNIS